MRLILVLTLVVGLVMVGVASAPAEAPDAGAVAAEAEGTAEAAVPTPDNLGAWISTIADHAKRGEWIWALGLVIVGLTWAGRRFGSKLIPWFKTKPGALVLAGLITVLTTVGTEMASTGELSLAMFGVGLSAFWASAGEWGHVKDAKPKQPGS